MFGEPAPEDRLDARLLAARSASAGTRSPKSLSIMSWIALCTLPLVLAYQAWTYWVFRKRIGTKHIPAAHAPSGSGH